MFNALTGLDIPAGFGGELRYGTVRVPDERIDWLSSRYRPKKTTYPQIRFCDLPGERASTGRALSPRALGQIREQEAMCLVIRDFEDPAAMEVADPLRDLNEFHAECLLADLEIVERRLERASKERANPVEVDAFERAREALEEGVPLRTIDSDSLDPQFFRGYGLLSLRPLLVVLNQGEDNNTKGLSPEMEGLLRGMGSDGIPLAAQVESEIASLEPEDRAAFLEDLGLSDSALNRFIRAVYGLLDLISFFTVGTDEVRGWTIRHGTGAREAAGRIHSDLERGFIRAEVIPYAVFREYGSERAVKEVGVLQVEGQDYVVNDGDIVHVRFNV